MQEELRGVPQTKPFLLGSLLMMKSHALGQRVGQAFYAKSGTQELKGAP